MGCGGAVLKTQQFIQLRSEYISEMKPCSLVALSGNTGPNGQVIFQVHNFQYSLNLAERLHKAITVCQSAHVKNVSFNATQQCH